MVTLIGYLKPLLLVSITLSLLTLGVRVAAADDWTWTEGSDDTGDSGTYGTLGTPAPSNTPGARREASAWRETGDALWLFGGSGVAGSAGLLNDLWRYAPAAGTWTWVSGNNGPDQPGQHGTRGVASPLNVPGARSGAAASLDALGRLWLFGGRGYDDNGLLGYLNDLWVY